MTLREWLAEEPFTLTMSSGFFGFFAHCGMLSVLEDEGLLPQKVTGSSAGSLVAAAWSLGMSANQIKDLFFSIDKKDFWDPGFGLGLLKGNLYRDLLRTHFPKQDLEEGRVPVAISVYDWKNKNIDVYSKGDAPTLVSASCAVPFLFQPVKYLGNSYLDGGIQDRPGLQGVNEDERVFYHHLVSRSPWRKKNDPALQFPDRDNTAALGIHGLPRSGPNKLDQGKLAFDRARTATQQALSQKLDKQGRLSIHC